MLDVYKKSFAIQGAESGEKHTTKIAVSDSEKISFQVDQTGNVAVQIQISADGTHWYTIKTITGPGYDLTYCSARYARACLAAGTVVGAVVSIWFLIYSEQVTKASTKITPPLSGIGGDYKVKT